jgi:tetratricopeptide (TPR) repeat protein
MYKNKQYVKYIPNILLEKGIALKGMGRIKEAIEIFDEITKGTDAPELQGKAWFELALIYQHEYGDFEKAKECYEKVLSLSTDSELTDIANERIKGIGLKDQYHNEIADKSRKKKSPGDSTSIYETQYKMAEVYWINLSEADSALTYFTRITSDTLADSAVFMKSLYARAWLLRFVKEDTVTADSIYNAIIARYPATLLAKKSQQDLGVSVTIKTREDSATLAFIDAERLYFDDKNPVAAVNQFYKVAKKYADIEEIGVNSIYAAAWMCDNVLNKNKKAFMLYKKLCDDYPESELCINEAKPRIKIVEDTLKILKAQEKQKKPIKQKKKKKTVTKKTGDKDTSTVDTEEDLLEPGEVDTTLEDESKVIETDTTKQKVDDIKVKEVQIELKEKKIEEEQ